MCLCVYVFMCLCVYVFMCLCVYSRIYIKVFWSCFCILILLPYTFHHLRPIKAWKKCTEVSYLEPVLTIMSAIITVDVICWQSLCLSTWQCLACIRCCHLDCNGGGITPPVLSRYYLDNIQIICTDLDIETPKYSLSCRRVSCMGRAASCCLMQVIFSYLMGDAAHLAAAAAAAHCTVSGQQEKHK